MARKPRDAGRAPRGRTLARLAVVTVIALVTLEIGARVWLVHFAGDATFRQYATFSQLVARYGEGLQGLRDEQALISHAPHRYLGYYPTPNYQRGANRHDSLGYRGEEIRQPKPSGEFRIVCLGGSTTYGAAVEDYRQAYPYLLQQELRSAGYERVTVVNAGVPGWSSWESLVNLEFRVADLDPDLILVLHAINDINARLVWPPEAYRGDNSGRRKAGATGIFMPGLLEYSTVARILLVRSGTILPHSALQRSVDPPADTYYGEEFLKQKLDGTYPSGIFAQVDAAEMLRRNPPIYFERNLRTIVAVAANLGIRTVLLTFNFSPYFDRAPRTDSPEYIAAFAEMNQVVRGVAAASDTPLIDLARSLPQDRRYYVDGHHMTPEGSLLKAKLIARFLIEHGLIHSPGPSRESALP